MMNALAKTSERKNGSLIETGGLMEKRYGNPEPTASIILPYTETKGQEAVDIYEKGEKKEVLDWEKALLYDIMALNDDGAWTHIKFGYAVPRRNGKSEVVLMRCLWGLKNCEKILYTAHRTSTAHAVWARLDKLCEDLELPVDSSFKAFGKEHIYIDGGGVIEFRTRTSTGGLGEGYDLLCIDEAQEYTPEQESTLKYTVSDSPNPQTLMLGTPPTAVSAGTVFSKYRLQLLEGGGFESGWAEWGVEKMTDPHDEDAWYRTNPSLGTVLKERSIRAEIGDDDIDFNIQRLGLWLKYNQKSAITKSEWDALKVDKMPKVKGKLFAGVKFGRDNNHVALSVAVRTEDDKIFTETVDCQPIRNGFAWIVNFVRKAPVSKLVIDGVNGAESLNDALKKAHQRKGIRPTVQEVIKANAEWTLAVAEATTLHCEQPSVDQVVTNCVKRAIGSAGGFGYSSQLEGADIAIMDSIILAYWICKDTQTENRQKVHY